MLSNHAIVALGILTRKSKQSTGAVKASEILNNHQQAYALLARTVLYGDEESTSLALELNKSLQIAPNLIHALASYIADIKNEAENKGSIEKQQQALSTFSQHIYDTPFHLAVYREASDALLSSAKKADVTFYLNLIRSFYPYWENTHSILIKAGEKKSASNTQLKQDLINFWNGLDATFLTAIEVSLLATYTEAIKTINIPDEQITLRTKIAKLILIKQRAYKNTPDGYRENINAIQTSLSTDDLLAYFSSVSREFYTIWLGTQIKQTEIEN